MKKFLKLAGLPIGVFALAIGSAFATNAMKSSLAIVPGYQKIDENGLECFDPKVMCDTGGTIACTWTVGTTTHNLYGEQGPIGQTACTLPLYEIQRP